MIFTTRLKIASSSKMLLLFDPGPEYGLYSGERNTCGFRSVRLRTGKISGLVGSGRAILQKSSSQIGSGFKPSKNKVETGRVVPGQPVSR